MKGDLGPPWNGDGALEPVLSEDSPGAGPLMPTTRKSRNPSCSETRVGSSVKSEGVLRARKEQPRHLLEISFFPFSRRTRRYKRATFSAGSVYIWKTVWSPP